MGMEDWENIPNLDYGKLAENDAGVTNYSDYSDNTSKKCQLVEAVSMTRIIKLPLNKTATKEEATKYCENFKKAVEGKLKRRGKILTCMAETIENQHPCLYL